MSAPKNNKFAAKLNQDKRVVRMMVNLTDLEARRLKLHLRMNDRKWAEWARHVILGAIKKED